MRIIFVNSTKLTVLFAFFFASMGAGSVLGQSKGEKAEAGQKILTTKEISKLPEPDVSKAGKRAKVLLDKIDVVGSLAKPQAIFIIPGSDPSVTGIAVERSFFQEIFRPVEKDYFPQKGRKKFRGAIPW